MIRVDIGYVVAGVNTKLSGKIRYLNPHELIPQDTWYELDDGIEAGIDRRLEND